MARQELVFTVFPEKYAICRLDSRERIPEWAIGDNFFSVTRTPDELSVICPQERAPGETECERAFRLIRVAGPISLSVIGVVAAISRVIANAGISLLTISTYETDYIMVKDKDLNAAIAALTTEGWQVTVL